MCSNRVGVGRGCHRLRLVAAGLSAARRRFRMDDAPSPAAFVGPVGAFLAEVLVASDDGSPGGAGESEGAAAMLTIRIRVLPDDDRVREE
jgi:hypothetical protein